MYNIYIVGYMGCGKSSFGRYLSNELDLSFIDLDHKIEQETGDTISNIFKQGGETHFRKLEQQTLIQSFQLNRTIVSTGGGTPTFENNMEMMNKEGITIYLKANVSTLFARLKRRKEHRPIIASLSDDELREFIENHLNQRRPYYKMAKLHLKARLSLPLLTLKVNQYLYSI